MKYLLILMNYFNLYFQNLKPFGIADFYPPQEDYRISPKGGVLRPATPPKAGKPQQSLNLGLVLFHILFISCQYLIVGIYL